MVPAFSNNSVFIHQYGADHRIGCRVPRSTRGQFDGPLHVPGVVAVIGAEGAAQLLVKRFPDPTAPEVQKIRQDFIDGYNLNMATPWIAAERGYIDGVIEPHETRLLLRKSLRMLRDKQPQKKVLRKHGLTPL